MLESFPINCVMPMVLMPAGCSICLMRNSSATVEVKAVKNKHTRYQGCHVTEEIMQKQINDQQLCSLAIINR